MMQFIKKILSIILLISLMFSTVCLAETEDIDQSGDIPKEIRLLNALGILDENDSILGKQKVSREQFVRTILRCFSIENIKSEHDPFSDNTGEYKEEMITAFICGLIEGDGSGRCMPAEPITRDTAVKIIIRAIGYKSGAGSSGGFYDSYQLTAERIGIFDGCKASEYITSGELVQVIMNTLEADDIYITSIKDVNGKYVVTYNVDKEHSIMNHIFNVYKNKGIVESNEISSIFGEPTVNEGFVQIEGVMYACGASEISEFLGYDTEFYYQLDEKLDERTVLYAYTSNRNKVYEFSGDDLAGVSAETIEFYNGSKKQSIKITPNVILIYNGKQTPFDPTLMINPTSGKSKIYGSITVIDNNSDGNAKIISVMNYRNIIVTGKSNNTCSVSDEKNGNLIYLDTSDEEYITKIFFNSKKISFEDIQVGTVISYAESIDKSVKYAIVSVDTVSGKITKKENDKIEIDGTAYDIGGADIDSFNIGDTGTFYIDFMGRIAGRKVVSDVVYGYLNKVVWESEFDLSQFLIFTENGNWVTLNGASKIKHNGKSYKADVFVNNICTLNPDVYRQLVRYKVNNSGELAEINFAQTFEPWSDDETNAIESNIFRKSYSYENITVKYRAPTLSFGIGVNGSSRVALTQNAKVFMIPSQSAENPADRIDFNVVKTSSLIGDYQYNGVISYDADRAGVAPVCVIQVEDKLIDEESPLFLVTETGGKTIGYDEQISDFIAGIYSGTEEIELVMADDSVLTSVGGVNKGDIIQFSFNSVGYVDRIIKLYDSQLGPEQRFCLNNIIYSRSTKVAGRVHYVNPTDGRYVIDYGASENDYTIFGSNSQIMVYLYDTKSNKVSLGEVGDIEKDDWIFASVQFCRIQEIIVFRNE